MSISNCCPSDASCQMPFLPEIFANVSRLTDSPRACCKVSKSESGTCPSGASKEGAGEQRTLLELAETYRIPLDSGCTYGDCGTCLTDLLSGDVEYLHQTGITPEPGTCLPCSCRPKTSVVLQA